ncbi:tRNA pseudouridine synthase 3 [Mactra antiquata]
MAAPGVHDVKLGKRKSTVEVDSLSREELMCRVRQLESHVKQLQNIVIKNDVSTSSTTAGRRKDYRAKEREFDFTRYNTRHVALKIMYFGCDYLGYASQEETMNTIEQTVLDALKKTKLMENRETANYERCGRTDKGVSAFGQVISLDLRTNLLSGVGVKVREGGTAAERSGDKTTEVPYCSILNRNLPPEIRVLAWAPVNTEFSSRFNCRRRTYKYFFPKANLDLDLMRQAAQKLVGEHDFRNFCKMNVKDGVIQFKRRILSVDISVVTEEEEDGYNMCILTVVGTAFLYHQIRYIVSVLFYVGKGLEQPEIVDELLNVEKNPRKPQYILAADFPLCLFDAEFEDDLEWIYEADWHEHNIKTLQRLWAEHSIKAHMLKKMLESLDKAKVETECDIAPWSDLSPPIQHQSTWIASDGQKVHKPLLNRQLGRMYILI